jgi:ribosomal protein S12 methylthiotransferase
MRSVHLISLGCPKNLIDSEHMLGLLDKAGVHYSPRPEGSDAIVINTCAFLQSSVQESLDVIGEALELKRSGSTKRVVVTGCLPQRYSGNLVTDLPDVDLFLGTGNFHQIASHLQALESLSVPAPPLTITDPDFLYDHNTPRLQATMPHTAYVKVSEGCSRTCAFCIIPKLRGRLRSRASHSVVEEVQNLVDRGVIEVNLVAQDLTAYGKDLSPRDRLVDLLRALCRIEGLHWLRLHYAYPHGFDDELVNTIAGEAKLCAYLDMPLQHIDNALLKRMRRQTSETAIRDLLKVLRARVPELTLRTTLIVGFPGEDDAAFAKLKSFVSEQQFDRLGVFAYSREEGTRAAEMDGQVGQEIKDRRRDELMTLQQKISLAKNQSMVGRRMQTLIEAEMQGSDRLSYWARLKSQAPEVDGKTIVHAEQRLPIGTILPVKIVAAAAYDLIGQL